MQDSIIQVMKIAFEGKIKIVQLQKDFGSLCKLAMSTFALDNGQFGLHYENDQKKLSLTNQVDYDNALLTMKDSKTKFKIFITEIVPEVQPCTLSKTCSIEFNDDIEKEEKKMNKSMIDLYQCGYCKRKFGLEQSYDLHRSCCKKVFLSKRVPYDCKKKRLELIARINQMTLFHLTSFNEYPKVNNGKTLINDKENTPQVIQSIPEKSNKNYNPKTKDLSPQWKKQSGKMRQLIKIARMLRS